MSWDIPIEDKEKTLTIGMDGSKCSLPFPPSKKGHKSIAVIAMSFEITDDRIYSKAKLTSKDKSQGTSLSVDYPIRRRYENSNNVTCSFDGKLPANGTVVLAAAGGNPITLTVADTAPSTSK
jgi:hypothetical protein